MSPKLSILQNFKKNFKDPLIKYIVVKFHNFTWSINHTVSNWKWGRWKLGWVYSMKPTWNTCWNMFLKLWIFNNPYNTYHIWVLYVKNKKSKNNTKIDLPTHFKHNLSIVALCVKERRKHFQKSNYTESKVYVQQPGELCIKTGFTIKPTWDMLLWSVC